MKLEDLEIYNLSMILTNEIWLDKSNQRKLIQEIDYKSLLEKLNLLGLKLNKFLKAHNQLVK